MNILGLLLLLFLVIAIRYLGNKVVPVAMPTGRLKTVGVGLVGALAASLLDKATWQIGPVVVGIYIVAAVVGAALFILLLGLAPFIKILLGRV